MTAINIYSIDDTDNQNVIACLPEGKHVLGRGGLLQVTDKRVSRKHAVIEVSKDYVSLTSIHVNPCFFKAANGKTLTVLSENQQYELNDGDQFALLPETCWFKVKISKEQDTENENGMGGSNVGVNGKRLYASNLQETDFNLDSKRARLSTSVSETSTHKEDATTNNITLELETNTQNDQTSHSHQENDNPEFNTSENTSLNLGEAAEIRTENNEIIADIKEEPKENNDVTTNTSEPIEGTTTENNITATKQIKQEPLSNSVKEEPADEDDTFEEPQPVVKTENADNESDKKSKDEASGSGTGAKKVRRERCWYGDRCFRKNPNHRATFSHPGDQDYDSDPDDDRPNCPYGTACYRQNIEHRREYKHVGKPAPKPTPYTTSPSPPCPPAAQNNQVNKKKRQKANTKKPKPQYDIDSSQDDYDLDDPFINDGSSDDYQPSDGIDSDSDYEDSQELDEESQERQRMLKEAKRFTKKGNKP